MKQGLSLFLLGLLTAGIFVGVKLSQQSQDIRERATTGVQESVNLSLSPADATLHKGDSLTVSVILNNPNKVTIDGYEIYLHFNPSLIKVSSKSIDTSQVFFDTIVEKSFNNTTGDISLIAVQKGNTISTQSNSTITLASIQFTVQTNITSLPATANVDFRDNKVIGTISNNISQSITVSSVQNGSYKITLPPTPTFTPTPTPTPTPLPPTPTPTFTPTPTPTPTPLPPTPTNTPIPPTATEIPIIPGDANGDGHVNIEDLSILLMYFGTTNPQADFDNSGKVNILDLSILLLNFGI